MGSMKRNNTSELEEFKLFFEYNMSWRDLKQSLLGK